jgi:hypothetical protein
VHVRKSILGGIAVTASLGAVLASGAFAGGNGAGRSGLSPQAGNNNNQCVVGSGSGTNGFAIVNAPGQPGNARFVNGEVSLKRGAANSAYTVWLVDSNGNCLPEGAIATNTVGNGNAHLDDATLTGGTFYVVLQDASGNEQFASGPITVN